MKLHELTKTTDRSKKRIGRGIGSGRGKTSARGQKGQKARGKVPQGFIGGTLPIYKKLPFRRGLGNTKRSVKPIALDISRLANLKAKTRVDVSSLIENKIVDGARANKFGVKIVGNTELKVALTVVLPTSQAAAAVITKAGGEVVNE